MSSHDDRDSAPPHRLRAPRALAVLLVGSTAALTFALASCDIPPKIPVDAAGSTTVDARGTPTPDGMDPNAINDAGVDSKMPDAPMTPPPPPIDAPVPPPPPIDAAPPPPPPVDAAPPPPADAAPPPPVDAAPPPPVDAAPPPADAAPPPADAAPDAPPSADDDDDDDGPS